MDQSEITPSSNQEEAEAKGFGKLYFSTQASKQQEEHDDNEQDLVSDVISRKELEKGRLSRDGKYNAEKQIKGRKTTLSLSVRASATTYYHLHCTPALILRLCRNFIFKKCSHLVF